MDCMYTGALFTLAEIPGGAIILSAFDMKKYFPTLAKSEIKFVKPATTDVTAELRLSESQLETM